MLLDMTSPDRLLGLVFRMPDNYVHGTGGEDGDLVIPALNRFKERIWYIHLKDLEPERGAAAAAKRSGIISRRCGMACTPSWEKGASTSPALLRLAGCARLQRIRTCGARHFAGNGDA